MPGILWESDYDSLKESVWRVLERFAWMATVRFIEIGVYRGETSKELIVNIYDWYDKHNLMANFVFYGIDPFIAPPPIGKDFTLISCPSHLAISQIPTDFHWVWVDGCHCYQCVERDLQNYGDRLMPGGELLFHDASPRMQGRDPQTYEGMTEFHDPVEAAKGIAVRRVLDTVMPEKPIFRLVQRAPDQQFGGVEVYQKV
jgi:hypothetical protein